MARAPTTLTYYYPSISVSVATSAPRAPVPVDMTTASTPAIAALEADIKATPAHNAWLVRHAAPMTTAQVDDVAAAAISGTCAVLRATLTARHTYFFYRCSIAAPLTSAFFDATVAHVMAAAGVDAVAIAEIDPRAHARAPYERAARQLIAASAQNASAPYPLAATLAERVQAYAVRGIQTTGVDWGLDRVDQRSLSPRNYRYGYPTTASTTTIYVIDTGTYVAHSEFAPSGRALFAANFIDGTNGDCHGHGTHTASLAAGVLYGTAKLAAVRAIKVLDCAGSGTSDSVVSGLEYILAECDATNITRARPLVVSMSLAGGYSQMMNDAIVAIQVACRAIVVVAAGNSNSVQCDTSPASAPGAVVVAASDATDGRAYFSNYGACVAVAAPGLSIRGAKTDGTSVQMSGTSMSTPLVAGVMAMGLEVYASLPATTLWTASSVAHIISGTVAASILAAEAAAAAAPAPPTPHHHNLPAPPTAPRVSAIAGMRVVSVGPAATSVVGAVLASATANVVARPGLSNLPLIYSALSQTPGSPSSGGMRLSDGVAVVVLGLWLALV